MVRQARQPHPKSRAIAGLLAAALIATLASPATAAPAPTTRLVRCGSESCLLVRGHRETTTTIVRLNGHAVPVEGGRSWRARLPVRTVRAWSAPFARTIEVMLGDAKSRAALPIGLMGHADLASLVVSVR